MNRKATNQYDCRRTGFIKSLSLVLAISLTAIGGLELLTGINAEAHSKTAGASCGSNAMCQSLEGKEFMLIKYVSFGSGLVVLYDKSEVGDVIPMVPEVNYKNAKGTVNDAIHFLSERTDFRGFSVFKGRKSTGWFKTEVIEGIYIVEPRYEISSDSRAAKYSLSEKGGKIKLRMTPVYTPGND
jgi:hypothetical protein